MCCLMISIHAPREGGDNESRIRPCVNENFNPRPPRGGRPLIDGQQRQRLPISIHAPREGGDEDVYAQIMAKLNISIHAPREGGDSMPFSFVDERKLFQSTPPARGATS